MECKNILPVERLSDTKASKRELYIRQKSEHEFVSPHALLKVQAVFFKMGQPRPLFVYFRSFQTINRIFTTNQCEKCQCIQFRLQDSNPRPFEHESSPITTRPGLLPQGHMFCLIMLPFWWPFLAFLNLELFITLPSSDCIFATQCRYDLIGTPRCRNIYFFVIFCRERSG